MVYGVGPMNCSGKHLYLYICFIVLDAVNFRLPMNIPHSEMHNSRGPTLQLFFQLQQSLLHFSFTSYFVRIIFGSPAYAVHI